MLGAPDTDPAITAWRDEKLRQLSVTEKLERVAALTRMMRLLARHQEQRAHPSATAEELDLLVARRWVPADLLEQAYGRRSAGLRADS